MCKLYVLRPNDLRHNAQLHVSSFKGLLQVCSLPGCHHEMGDLLTALVGWKSGTVVPLCDFQRCITETPINTGLSPPLPSRAAPAQARAPLHPCESAAKMELRFVLHSHQVRC